MDDEDEDEEGADGGDDAGDDEVLFVLERRYFSFNDLEQ